MQLCTAGCWQTHSFNRTLVELKYVTYLPDQTNGYCFNRTLVELKYHCDYHYTNIPNVLIVP